MMSRPDPDDPQSTDAKSEDGERLRFRALSAPESVPVFSCVVYISPARVGGVHARVANLYGIEATAANEREALAKVVPLFKQRIAELMGSGKEIPWLEPPAEIAPEEQERLVPVHL